MAEKDRRTLFATEKVSRDCLAHGEMKKRRSVCRQTLNFPGLIYFLEVPCTAIVFHTNPNDPNMTLASPSPPPPLPIPPPFKAHSLHPSPHLTASSPACAHDRAELAPPPRLFLQHRSPTPLPVRPSSSSSCPGHRLRKRLSYVMIYQDRPVTLPFPITPSLLFLPPLYLAHSFLLPSSAGQKNDIPFVDDLSNHSSPAIWWVSNPPFFFVLPIW